MMKAKQRAFVESEQLTATVNTILDAAVEHLCKSFPNATEIERSVNIKETVNGACKVGVMIVSGTQWADFLRVEFSVGFASGKQRISMNYAYRNTNEIGFGSYHEVSNETKAAIMAIAQAK